MIWIGLSNNLHVAATFPYFHAKKGTKLLQKAAFHPAGHCRRQCLAAEQQVLEQLIAAPSEAETTLKQIQQETMEALHLPETVERVQLSSSATNKTE